MAPGTNRDSYFDYSHIDEHLLSQLIFMPHRKLPHQTGAREKVIKLIKRIPFWLSLLSVLLVIYDLGFNQEQWLQRILNVIFLITLLTGTISIAGRYFSR